MKHISKMKLAVLGFALGFGIWLGYLTKSGLDAGGINGMFALAGVVLAGLVLLLFGFVALLSAKQPDGTGGPAARATMFAAAWYVVGLGSGWFAAMVVTAAR